jgi:hypothetical protein
MRPRWKHRLKSAEGHSMNDTDLPEPQDFPVRGRPFPKGQSGNPGGRPPGARNRAALLAEQLLADEAEALTRKAVELALGGDRWALRLCLERVVAPRREQPVQLPLPDLRDAVSLADAMAVISAAVSDGGITPLEASELGKLVDTFRRAVETADFERRLNDLEAATREPGRSDRG